MSGDHPATFGFAAREITAPTNEISQNVVGAPNPEHDEADVPVCAAHRPVGGDCKYCGLWLRGGRTRRDG